MKKLMLLSFFLFAATLGLSAQKTIYVIDNETVEHFDGSQLKGKTVSDYKISTTGTGRNAITVHAITTSLSPFSYYFSRPHRDTLKMQLDRDHIHFLSDTTFLSKDFIITNKSPKKVVYIIDGRLSEGSEALRSISPLDIASIKVLKDDSPEAKALGGNVSVIKIQTKKSRE